MILRRVAKYPQAITAKNGIVISIVVMEQSRMQSIADSLYKETVTTKKQFKGIQYEIL